MHMHLASQMSEPLAIRRPRLRVVSLVQLDKRTRIGRRVGELVANFTEALSGQGAISRVLAMKVADAATLKAIAERARDDHLAGRNVSLAHLMRVERRADNAVKVLGMKEPEKAVGVKAYLASQKAAREAAGA
jgi:hypothetical protein